MEQEYEVRRKVAWTGEEDYKLRDYVNTHGPHLWDTMARNLGIGRSGNSCRLRWFNYLSPDIRRGQFTHDEMLIILNLHHQIGNRWSKIAKELPGRSDNDIKNFWNTRVVKEAKQLNCDANSQEFLMIMTSRLTGSGGGTAATLVNADQEILSDHGSISDEFWSNLGSICDLDDHDDDFLS